MNIKSSVAVACFFPGRAKDFSAPEYTVGCSVIGTEVSVAWFSGNVRQPKG